MLILPLHRSLNRSNFPWLTLLLILANCFVFLFLQSGDRRVERQAIDYYQQSGLGGIEFPAYLAWLQNQGGDAHRVELAQAAEEDQRVALIQSDPKFLEALHADRIIQPADDVYADWHAKRAEFERILDDTFTQRHALRFSRFEPARLLSAMFMHGGMGHLLGNMLFLAILGMLVEGALGPGWFLGLYLAGGTVAGLASLAWHWGSDGIGLGASGAIGALLGAYCVIWGARKVRVFYWFFVVFDYVKVPALVLLPFWFGVLVLFPWLSHDPYIDFADHAGGIASGAALALVLRRKGRVRDDFVEEDERVEQREHARAAFEQAQHFLGQLEIPKAREILQRIDAAEPGQLKVLVALYRCARYRGTPAELDAAAARVLGFHALGDADVRELLGVYRDYAKSCAGVPRLAPELLLGLVKPWLRLGEDAAAESLLGEIAASQPQFAGLPAAWLAFALDAPEGSANRRARLAHLIEHYPHSDNAPKARFLLDQG